MSIDGVRTESESHERWIAAQHTIGYGRTRCPDHR